MDATELDRRLCEAFDAPDGECRVVVRQAGDLSNSGRYRTDAGVELSAEAVVSNLRDAPDDLLVPEKWNWWMGSLEIAYGGYSEFQILRWKRNG
jgi:hypothetical protein